VKPAFPERQQGAYGTEGYWFESSRVYSPGHPADRFVICGLNRIRENLVLNICPISLHGQPHRRGFNSLRVAGDWFLCLPSGDTKTVGPFLPGTGLLATSSIARTRRVSRPFGTWVPREFRRFEPGSGSDLAPSQVTHDRANLGFQAFRRRADDRLKRAAVRPPKTAPRRHGLSCHGFRCGA